MSVDFNLGTSNNKFQGTFLITQKNNNVLTLHTGNTFVDQDIKLTFNVKPATLSVKYSNNFDGDNSTIFNNITTDNNIDNGISISVGGSPGAVICDGPIEGYISKKNNDILIPAASGTSAERMVYNISGVTLTPPASGTRYFNITVPNGNSNDYVTFRFSVDSNCNVNVDGV